MRKFTMTFVMTLMLMVQFISGGRLAHIHANGELGFCLEHDISDGSESGENQAHHDCGCSPHDHASVSGKEGEKSPTPSPDHHTCKSSLQVVANSAAVAELPTFEFIMLPSNPYGIGAKALPRTTSLSNAHSRAPPGLLVSGPPDAPPIWLGIQSLRL